jgi:hypothetical protein
MGEQIRGQSASLRRWSRYRNCLTFTANQQGLHVSIFFLFRSGHPPLWIPWSEITVHQETTFGLEYTRLEVPSCHTSLRVQRPLADRLLAHAPASLSAA